MKISAALALAFTLPALAGDSNYDALPEGFLGTTFSSNGVTYRECNDVGGSFPNGEHFTAQDIGNNFIIENSTYLFDNFPQFGSRPNTLTFGTAYIPGPNLSIGAFARATLDLDQTASYAEVQMAFYENGPWGGIVFHLDALNDGQVVASDSLTIRNGGGRDNVALGGLSVREDAAGFTTLKLYATWGDGYSAPRLLIDNLGLVPWVPPCPADFNHDGFLDFMDYADFVACFETGSCPTATGADFNRDGFVDFFDYLEYAEAFVAGC